VGTAGAAQADWSDCPIGRACLWADAGYVTNAAGTAQKHLSFLSFQNSYENFGRGVYPYTSLNGNDTGSSATNNGRYSSAQFFYNNLCQGLAFQLDPGNERDPDFSNGVDTHASPPVYNANDNITGAKFVGATCAP